MELKELKKRVELLASKGCTEFETFRALAHLMRGCSESDVQELKAAFYAEEKAWYERRSKQSAAGKEKI